MALRTVLNVAGTMVLRPISRGREIARTPRRDGSGTRIEGGEEPRDRPCGRPARKAAQDGLMTDLVSVCTSTHDKFSSGGNGAGFCAS